jgi:hypothetical protein
MQRKAIIEVEKQFGGRALGLLQFRKRHGAVRREEPDAVWRKRPDHSGTAPAAAPNRRSIISLTLADATVLRTSRQSLPTASVLV